MNLIFFNEDRRQNFLRANLFIFNFFIADNQNYIINIYKRGQLSTRSNNYLKSVIQRK